MTSSALSNRSLANAALAALATFPLIVIALHIVQRGHYHPLSQAVSELALGRAGWLMWIAFCGAGTGLICLGILHRRLVERSRTAPVLLATAGILAYVSAVFHADPENATTTSLHDEIHQTASLIAFVMIIIAMFVSSRRFHQDPRWQRLAPADSHLGDLRPRHALPHPHRQRQPLRTRTTHLHRHLAQLDNRGRRARAEDRDGLRSRDPRR